MQHLASRWHFCSYNVIRGGWNRSLSEAADALHSIIHRANSNRRTGSFGPAAAGVPLPGPDLPFLTTTTVYNVVPTICLTSILSLSIEGTRRQFEPLCCSCRSATNSELVKLMRSTHTNCRVLWAGARKAICTLMLCDHHIRNHALRISSIA